MKSLVVGEDEERGVCSPSQEQAAVAGDGALCSFSSPRKPCVTRGQVKAVPYLAYWKKNRCKNCLRPSA